MNKASLLSQWKEKKKSETPALSIGRAPDDAALPLSYSQRGLWFLQQVYPDNPFYNYSELYRFQGELQVDMLIDALRGVINNHDILRTVYYEDDGQPFMRTIAEPQMEISHHDLRDAKGDVSEALKAIWDADAKRGFDLSTPPTVRVSLVRLSEGAFQLMLTLHHITTDKWSMNLLREEWAENYRALAAGKTLEPRRPRIQFPDFAYWQRSREIKADQLRYWKNKLGDELPIIDLPSDFPRPKNPTFIGRSSEVQPLSKETSERIIQACKTLGVTPHTYFLAIYYLFLHRYTGQTDILIGSPISNRDRKELEDTIGFFNDTIVLRTEFERRATFSELLAAVKKTSLEAFSNKEIPFDVLVRELNRERSLSINPFFQVMFLYYSAGEPESFGKEVGMDFEFYNPGVSKFDLTFDVAEKNGMLSFAFEYSTELFRPETIQRFHDYMSLLIDGVLAEPDRQLSGIPMIPAHERQFLMPNAKEANEAGAYKNKWESFSGIHQAIEQMALAHPDAVAVSFREHHLTYGDFNRRAEVLARKIFGKTKEKNAIIGLCAERSLEMVVGLLAILKAGCAYLPIDPKYPADRIRFMVEDADMGGLVTQQNLVPLFDKSLDGIFLLDAVDARDTKDIMRVLGAEDSRDSDVETLSLPVPDRSDLAYVIYTSGSTGKPKGVAISHGNILSSTAGRLDFYPTNPKAFLLLSSISFDSSKAGIFWTLCTGGNLVIAPARIEQDMERLGALIQQHKVGHTLMLPSLYQLLLELGDTYALTSLSTIMVAGEACPVSLVEKHFSALPETQLYNEYGPTEATVWCTAHKIERGRTSRVPLGRPVAGADIYLLDAQKNLAPRGAVGEIYIGGDGLSKGYVKRPGLTAERFIGNPFFEKAEGRLYKTGDLARYNTEGNLEFMGRSDQQIKIRGYRVELGEIEKAIRTTGKFSEVVVLVEELGVSSKRLVSYVSGEEHIESNDLRLELKRRLPDYMVPASVVQIAKMPMLPNGKIDTVALRKHASNDSTESEKTGQLPRNELERKLQRIWSELLERDAIGIHDNFFDFGGDSILSIRLITEARKEDIQLTPNQIFDNQTIADLAEYIQAKENREEEWDYLVALRKTGSEKPLFCIHAGGGHVFFYNVLTKYIGAHRPIYALQASGVYAGMEMHHSIEDMAADYIEAIRNVQPEGPYNIMAYCFSVAVGNEMLLQLRNAGQNVNLIVADTMTDPWKLDTRDRLRMRMKSFAKRLVSNPYATIKGMINERLVRLRIKLRKMASEGDDKALAKLNDNLARICARYIWRPHQEKVTVLLTPKPDDSINKEVVGSWKKVALGGVEVVPTEGDHIDLFAEPRVAEVAAKIEANCI